jgi:hypothetical protein
MSRDSEDASDAIIGCELVRWALRTTGIPERVQGLHARPAFSLFVTNIGASLPGRHCLTVFPASQGSCESGLIPSRHHFPHARRTDISLRTVLIHPPPFRQTGLTTFTPSTSIPCHGRCSRQQMDLLLEPGMASPRWRTRSTSSAAMDL